MNMLIPKNILFAVLLISASSLAGLVKAQYNEADEINAATRRRGELREGQDQRDRDEANRLNRARDLRGNIRAFQENIRSARAEFAQAENNYRNATAANERGYWMGLMRRHQTTINDQSRYLAEARAELASLQ